MINPFPDWSDDIHDQPDQKRKFAKAVHGDVILESLDLENQSATFHSSDGPDTYQTSLRRCTCPSFNTHKPCKHMYRLALELGLLMPTDIQYPKSDIPTPSKQNRPRVPQRPFSDAIAELENLPDICQTKAQFYSQQTNILPLTPELEPLTLSPLFTRISPTVELLSDLRKKEIIECCTSHDFEPPEHGTKAKLAAWCVENASECFFAYIIAPEFDRACRKIRTYLSRKNEWATALTEQGFIEYPAGSKQQDFTFSINISPDGVQSSSDWDNKYYFPDDEITKLLTLYGHNRCLNGFTAISNPDYH